MNEMILDTSMLSKTLHQIIQTEKVRISEADGIIQIVPIKEMSDCTIGLRGMFAGDSNMTVDRFLERKRADKELER